MHPEWRCAVERSERNSGQKVTPVGTISEKISHTAGGGIWRREVRRAVGGDIRRAVYSFFDGDVPYHCSGCEVSVQRYRFWN
ncbi:MAG: hypothetical protein DRQ24_01300 [Candidatus Latescibacterota bacterium]|nr:MAG: hypothetical protein DRQ24_01300 [Candidatus Latescibacterota bacterium]